MKRRWMTTLAVALTLMTRAIAAEETPPPLSPEQRALRIEAISKSAFGRNLPQICDKKTIELANSNISTHRIGQKQLRNGMKANFSRLITKSDLSRVYTDELMNADGKFYFGKDKVFQLPLDLWDQNSQATFTVPIQGTEKYGRVLYNPTEQTLQIYNAFNPNDYSFHLISATEKPEEFAKLKKMMFDELSKQYDTQEKRLQDIAAGIVKIPEIPLPDELLQQSSSVTVVEVDGEEALQLDTTHTTGYSEGNTMVTYNNKYQEFIRRRDGVLLKTISYNREGFPSQITVYSNYSFDVPDSAFAVPEGMQIVKCKDERDYYSKPDHYDWDEQQTKYVPLVEAKYMTSYPVLPGMTRQPIIVIPSSPWKPLWLWIAVGGAAGAIIGGTIYMIQKRRNA